MVGRILGAVVVLLVAAALAVLAWPQLVGLEQAFGIAQVVAMRGAAAAGGFVVVIAFTLVALLWRGARAFFAALAILTLAFVAVNVAVIVNRGIGGTGMPTPGPGAITVLTWNTLGETPSTQTVADLIEETAAVVVALPETTADGASELVAELDARGIPMQAFTFAYDTIAKANSTTLLVSAVLGEYTADTSAVTTSNRPSLVATPVSGVGPVLAAIHTTAPTTRDPSDWQTDLRWLAELCTQPDLIVAGDLNSTVDHWASLAHEDGAQIGGCADAALQVGAGGLGTWPTAVPALLGAPIDHVLVGSAWKATAVRVIESEDRSGSDHRPVLAQLVPAGGDADPQAREWSP